MPRSPLDILTALATKEPRLVCGIMSGTSVDAIDTALVRLRGGGAGTEMELVHYSETLFPEEAQQLVFSASEVSSSNVYDVCVLHAALAELYADAVRHACSEAGLGVSGIDLIGLHGQTLHHIPETYKLGRHEVRSTMQAGSGPMLAALLGVPVLHDFRSADMALGGQGAPLVPYADYILFRSVKEDRIILNIGGIANLTWLPAGCGEDDVLAMDTGPGNMIADSLMRRFFGREFDEGGAVARTGRVNADLLSWMFSHPFFARKAPKSTGREAFGGRFLENFLQIARDLELASPADLVATASEFTVRGIARAASILASPERKPVLYIGGGGAKNLFFTEGLRHSLSGAVIRPFDELGMPAAARESVCFAVLANEWLHGNATNLPRVTGASRKTLLGSFSTG